jgi:diacylglycerol kinase (ATP)
LRLLCIANPFANYGRVAETHTEIHVSLASFARVQWNLTDFPGHATELVSEADLASFDGVIAVGGDGTLFEVLNGLYRHKAENWPVLGLIPTGTGNAFARDLDLSPGDWPGAIKLIERGRSRRIDVGRVTTPDDRYYFLNIIGMGFAVDAGRMAKKLKMLGNAAYTIGAVWQILKLKSRALEIEIDGQLVKQDNVFVEVSNTRYTGTTFLMAPNARLDDGLLDVTLLSAISRFRLLRLFRTIYTGEHIHLDSVTCYQARRIIIHSPLRAGLMPDGEFRGQTPAVIECLPGDVRVFG